MPALSDQLIDKAKSRDKVYFLWDSEIKGLGVKITPAGGKTFVFQWQQPGANQASKRRKLGNCSDLSISQAREIANVAREKIKNHQESEGLFKQVRKPPSAALNKGKGNVVDNTLKLESDLLNYFDSAGVSTRDKIVSVATRVFINEGFDVSLESIAKHSGYTRLTVYRYFKNKETLADAVIEEVAERFFEVDKCHIDYDAPPQEALLEFASLFRRISLGEEHISFYRLLNSVSRERSLNLFEKVVLASHRLSIRMVANYFDYLVEKGTFRPINTGHLAEHFLVSIPGFDRSKLQKGLVIRSEKDASEYLQTLVESFLFGVMTRESS